MTLANCLAVMLGGALGTLLRYVLTLAAAPISRDLPWGTILINLSGSFVIGLAATLALASGRGPASETLRLFVTVGLCGGFTTFSAFGLQTFDLLRDGAIVRASLNVALSVLLCVAAAALGHLVAVRLNGDATPAASQERPGAER